VLVTTGIMYYDQLHMIPSSFPESYTEFYYRIANFIQLMEI